MQTTIFGAIVFGQICLGQMSLNPLMRWAFAALHALDMGQEIIYTNKTIRLLCKVFWIPTKRISYPTDGVFHPSPIGLKNIQYLNKSLNKYFG